MICPRCGVANNEADEYCQACGRSLSQPKPVASEVPAKPSAQSEPEPLTQQWSKPALIDLALSGIALFLFIMFFFVLIGFSIGRELGEILPLIVFIMIIISLACGHIAISERASHNKASFWIAIVSLFLGYGLLLSCIVMSFFVFYFMATW